MKCVDCPYYWKDENDDFPCCHFDGLWEAPCEIEDDCKENLDAEGY